MAENEQHAEQLRALLYWFQTSFSELSKDEPVSVSDLSSGILLYRAGQSLSSEYFPEAGFLSEADTTDLSWMKKSNILKQFSAGLVDFFHDVVAVDIEDELSNSVDVLKIAKTDNPTCLLSLLKLLLAAAINSKEKQVFVESIMSMEDSIQEQLMYVIQEFSEYATPSHVDGEEEESLDEGASEEDNTTNDNFEGALPSQGTSEETSDPSSRETTQERQRSSSITSMASSDDGEMNPKRGGAGRSGDESAALRKELERLKIHHRALNTEHEAVLEERSALHGQLKALRLSQSKYEDKLAANKAKERAMKAEALNQEHAQELERRLERAEQSLNDARALASEKQRELESIVRSQADELEIAKTRINGVEKMELQLTKAKQKMSEHVSLKSTIKELEDQNMQYMEKMLAMESTVSTIPQLKQQVERYNNKVVDLDSTVTGKNAKMLNQEKEISKVKKEMNELRSQRKQLREDLDTAQVEIEALKDEMDAPRVATGSGSSTQADKETIGRLERQVKALRGMQSLAASQATSGAGAPSADVQMLKDELDDAQRGKERLQQDYLNAQAKIADLETALSENSSKGSEASSAGPSSPPPSKVMDRLKSKNDRLAKQNNELKQELMDIEQKLADMEDHTNATAEQQQEQEAIVSQLKEQLKEKESSCNQLSLEKEKLENYVKQALKVTKMKYKAAVQTLQEQNAKKDEVLAQLTMKVDVLTSNREHMKAQHRSEERLVMSALYEVGLEMQRRMVAPSPTAPGATGMSSWLNRARRRKIGGN